VEVSPGLKIPILMNGAVQILSVLWSLKFPEKKFPKRKPKFLMRREICKFFSENNLPISFSAKIIPQNN
jgi:hypothetical protein